MIHLIGVFLATLMGAITLLGAIIVAAKGNYDQSTWREICAVAWFILAAILFK